MQCFLKPKVQANSRAYPLLAALALSLLISACSSTLPTVPALGDSGQWSPGKVVWHDLLTTDIEQAKSFYGELFGWTFDDVASGYTLVKNQGSLIAGIASVDSMKEASHWLPLISVSNVDETVDRAKSVGGSLVIAPFDLKARGRIAVLKDSRGAAFNIVHSTQGDPLDEKAGLNDWLWDEIWTDDLAAAERFYPAIADYRVAEESVMGVDYHYFEASGNPRVGLIKKPDAEIGNTWVAYIRVADVAAIARKAEALGGTLLQAPEADLRGGTVAVIADPGGAGFIVQEWMQ